MTHVTLTGHAISRFQERFAGNLSWAAAARRLGRLLRRAKFMRMCAGKARLYTLGVMRFVVQDRVLVTVYRLQYDLAGPPEDLWCLA
ncbi:hypothetical protein LAJ19_14885 (plasmid) [Deinococcus taeanensis]|uniref:hypothetical protein n=1 Tax=Deinococcus taeanensis TaxID=2737050 RepID=UPI001CDCF63F|nr:hypothetical protein [Deinococcus taeanensis]UBV44094.1 hypothetical protein LAJ19_14885 [Deinococcus taeanensis]